MSGRTKRLKWGPPEPPPPARPYRDSAIFYAILSVLIVVVAWITGGGIGRAIGIAVFFFVVATGWSFWRWRQRLDRSNDEAGAGGSAGDREPTA